MDIYSLNDERPVEIVNRNLLFIKKNLYYNRDENKGKPSYKNGEEYCKKKLSSSKFIKNKYNRKLCYRKQYLSKAEKAKKAREERAKKAREERAKKAREEKAKKAKKDREEKAKKAKKDREEKAKKAKKDREEKAKKAREEKAKKAREEKAKKDKEKNDPNNKNKDDNDDDNNDNNNNNNNNNNNDNNVNPPNQTGTPELTDAPTNSYQMTQFPAATFAPTNTYMSNASSLPSEDGRQTLSVAGISVISVIIVGVIVLIGLAIYRKRNNMRRGAVRLYDEPDQNDTSVMPRYLSMRSLRIPSMPPKVQLTRLSSATLLIPFRDNNPSPLNNNNINPAPSFNNLNNNYLSPYTKVHNLLSPNSSSSGGLTVNNNLEQNSQKTDSVQSHESYSSLESSFPIPPQRAFNDSYNTTPTSATFGDMYKSKK